MDRARVRVLREVVFFPCNLFGFILNKTFIYFTDSCGQFLTSFFPSSGSFLSSICFVTPTSNSSTLCFKAEDVSMNLASKAVAWSLPSTLRKLVLYQIFTSTKIHWTPRSRNIDLQEHIITDSKRDRKICIILDNVCRNFLGLSNFLSVFVHFTMVAEI